MLLSALASFLSLSKIYFKPFSMGLSFLAKYSTALKFKHRVTEGFQRSPQEKETGQERSRWYHQVDFVERKSSTPAWAVVLHHSEFKQINIKGTHLALKWDLSLEIVAVQHRPWGLGHVYYTHVILSQLRFFFVPHRVTKSCWRQKERGELRAAASVVGKGINFSLNIISLINCPSGKIGKDCT